MAEWTKAVRKTLETDRRLDGKLWQFLGLGSKSGIFSSFLNEKEVAKKKAAPKRASKKPVLALAPHISVDCVIFGYDSEDLKVLLTVENNKTSKALSKSRKSSITIPGDEVKDEEDFDESAKRISREVTGVENIFLEQFRALGYPGHKKDDWLKVKSKGAGNRVVKVAYFAIMNLNNYGRQPAAVDPRLKWYPVKNIPELAADNSETLQKALETLRFKLKYFPLVFELLPTKFTLGEAQALYEAIAGKKLDKRNFRRKLSGQNLLIPLDEKQKEVSHKPAQLYQFNFTAYERLIEQTSPFPVF